MRRVAVTLADSESASENPGSWTVTERWKSSGLKPFFDDFVVHKGHAYGFDGAILSAIDLADGRRIWKGGRYGNGQLILLAEQDLLLVTSEEGELVLVSATPDKFNEIARVPGIEGKTWNHPALAGDVLHTPATKSMNQRIAELRSACAVIKSHCLPSGSASGAASESGRPRGNDAYSESALFVTLRSRSSRSRCPEIGKRRLHRRSHGVASS